MPLNGGLTMAEAVKFTLAYLGQDADRHEIDFYDLAQALIGFERSLALTTHLVLTGEIITQAPYLTGAKIVARPPQSGSWEFVALIYLIGRGVFKLGTAPRDTPIRGAFTYRTLDVQFRSSWLRVPVISTAPLWLPREASIPMQIDIGFGNAIEPGAKDVHYPTLLDAQAPNIRAYPHEAVVAEKLHSLVILGERNSRMKDFYDLHTLAGQFTFAGPTLSRAIAATFNRRKTKIDAAVRRPCRNLHRSQDANCRGQDSVRRELSAEPRACVSQVEGRRSDAGWRFLCA